MNRRGFSVVEVLVYMAAATWISLLVYKYIAIPFRMTSLMSNVSYQQTTSTAATLPFDDLKCALSASMQWDRIDPTQANPPYDPWVNCQYIPWFQVNDPSIEPPELPVSYVCYKYRATDAALLRYFISGEGPAVSPITTCDPVLGDNAQEKVVARNLVPPTPAYPLFRKDPASDNMVVLNLRFVGPDKKVVTVVRRVHLRT